MNTYKDIFEAILTKLNAATLLREKRAVDVWILEERRCVQYVVNHLRAMREYPPVSMEDVERAERMALGHSDYVRKYAHAAADLVLAEKPWA